MFGNKSKETNTIGQSRLTFGNEGNKAIFEDNITSWMKEVDAYPWCNRKDGVNKNVMTYEFMEKQIVSLLQQVTGYSDEYTFQFITHIANFPKYEVLGRIQKNDGYAEPLHLIFKNTGYHDDPLYLLVVKPEKTYYYAVKTAFHGGNPLSASWISATLEQYEKKDKNRNRKINCYNFNKDYYFAHCHYADELLVAQVNYPETLKSNDQENPFVDIESFEEKLLHSDEATSGKITDIYKMLCLALKEDLEDYPKIIVKRYKVLENKDKELLESIETHYGNHKDIRLMDDTKIISIYSDNTWSHQTDTVTWTENPKGVSRTVQAKNVYELNQIASSKEEYDAAAKDIIVAKQLLKSIETKNK